MAHRLATHETFIDAFVLRHDPVRRKMGDGATAAGLAHAARGQGIPDQLAHPRRETLDVSDPRQLSGDAVLDDFRYASGLGRDDGEPRGRRLERGKSESLELAGREEQVGLREDAFDLLFLARELDIGLDSQFPRQGAGRGPLRPDADHPKTRVMAVAEDAERLDRVERPLHGPEIRNVYDAE